MEEEYMEEWEIKGGSEEEIISGGNGKVCWILNKGLTLGKRILVTGFVITSAPVLLPPLFVMSAIGLACSVPYGLFLASYACTEKLMTALLPPLPSHPSLLAEYCEAKDSGSGPEKEEEEPLDLQETLVANENEELLNVSDGDMHVPRGLLDNDEEGIVEEYGYGEEKPSMEIEIKIEGIEENEKTGRNFEEDQAPVEVISMVVQVLQVDEGEKDDQLESETRGLIEKLRDKAQVNNGVEEEKQSVENVYGGAGRGNQDIDDMNIIEMVKQFSNTTDRAGMELPIRENGQKVEQTSGLSEDMGCTKSKRMQTAEEIRGSQEKRSPADRAEVLPVGRANDKHDIPLNRGKEVIISSNADAREIADESGFYLFDDKNDVRLQYSYADCEKSEGSEQSSYSVSENVDSLELTLPIKVNESKQAGIPSEEDNDLCSIKVVDSEENIWKKIDAMRTIVGYTAPHQATCIEELKALYLFTGVEPPASFKGSSDLVEVNEKLWHLMSIVGVK